MIKKIIYPGIVFLVFIGPASAQLSFTAPATVCPYQVFTLTAQHGTVSGFTYSWSTTPPGAAISHSMLPTTMMLFPNSPGVYTISLVATLSSGTASASQQVTVYPIPTVQVSSASPTVCEGAVTSLTATGAGQYTWMPGNVQASVVALPAGHYTILGMSAGCTGSTQVNIDLVNCVGLPEFSGQSFYLFPQPAAEVLRVRTDRPFTGQINVRQVSGQICQQTAIGPDAESVFSISLSDLPPGIYLLEMTDRSGQKFVRRFAK